MPSFRITYLELGCQIGVVTCDHNV